MKLPKIIFEDEEIIVLNKDPHILSIPDRYDASKKNLRDILLWKYPAIFTVHRLDKETSGIIIFAKTQQAHGHLSDQMETRSIEKIYHAIAVQPTHEKGMIDRAIKEMKFKKGFYEVNEKGKASVTQYEVIEELGKFALLQLHLITGRTHQIRVHLKHIGAPLLSDAKYGLADSFFLSSIKKIKRKAEFVERPLISRTSLHAASLKIMHPSTNQPMTFEAEWPKDFKACIHQLRKSLK